MIINKKKVLKILLKIIILWIILMKYNKIEEEHKVFNNLQKNQLIHLILLYLVNNLLLNIKKIIIWCNKLKIIIIEKLWWKIIV